MLMKLFNYGSKNDLFLFMVLYDKVLIILYVFVFSLREYYIYNKIIEDYN